MTEKSRECRLCNNFRSAMGREYGRCAVHVQYDKDTLGKEILNTERPAIRFNTDTCDEFTPKEKKNASKL